MTGLLRHKRINHTLMVTVDIHGPMYQYYLPCMVLVEYLGKVADLHNSSLRDDEICHIPPTLDVVLGMAITIKQKDTKLPNYQMVLLPSEAQKDDPRYLFIRANPMCQGTNLDPITKEYNKPHSVTHVGDMMINTRAPRTMRMQQKHADHGSDWKAPYGAYGGSSDTKSSWDFKEGWKTGWSAPGSSSWTDWSHSK